MTVPPLPASPCLRVRLDYTQNDQAKGGNRIYLSYAGASPTGANCQSIASAIAAAWATDIAPVVGNTWSLTEVDVLDIASYVGLSGDWTGQNTGAMSGSELPANVSSNVEFDIARRYRGGKPRIFLPPPDMSAMNDASHWTEAYLTSLQTAVDNFFTAVAAIDVGAVGQLAHVNLSYYQGFKNITNSSGRERAVPQYRDTALVDSITGYAVKGEISSQRRRRVATTY